MEQPFNDSDATNPLQSTKLLDALRDCLVKCALQGDSVALPGFGTFMTVKDDERVDRDLSTGRQVLLPPHLSVSFKGSTSLIKAINQFNTRG